MKDKSKKLTVVNTDNRKPAPSGESTTQVVGGGSFGGISIGGGLDYLLKAIWDKVWEIKTDSQGNEYIFGKLPVVTQYGITMYADGGELDLPSIYAGIPFDNKTIWLNPETGLVEVLGGTGGGSGEGVSNFWDLSNIPSWITATKPKYSYSEIEGTPDLSVYVTSTALGETLADYVKSSVLASELAKYVTLGGDETITGLKDFTKGIQIDGLGITKSQDDVIYLDANLVVRGGITMYAEGEVDIPSILDSLAIASTTAKGIASFDSSYFSVDSDGKVTLLAENVGLNETELAAYLSNKGYATQAWVNNKGYALSADLSALQTKVDDFLEGSDTDTIINKWLELEAFLSGLNESDNLATILSDKADKATTLAGYGITDAYTKTNVDDLLKLYVTLAGTQTITGEKDFTGGLKVNGSPIVYDATNKYWKLEGDLLVTGGVTMYGSDSEFTPSTIMDGVIVDGVTIKKDPTTKALYFAGSVDGGEAGSVAWDNVTGKPSFATVATSGRYSDLSGVPTLLSSFTNDAGYLTSHQTIYNLTMQAGTFSAKTFDPNGAAMTVNIPTTTSHISEGSNLYFTNARAVSALASTLSGYLPLSGGTLTNTLYFTANSSLTHILSEVVLVLGVDNTRVVAIDTTSLFPTQALSGAVNLGATTNYWKNLYLSDGIYSDDTLNVYNKAYIEGNDADILTLKRNNTHGGAFVSYKPMNQDNFGWLAGPNMEYDFTFQYYKNGAVANELKAIITPEGNMFTLGNLVVGSVAKADKVVALNVLGKGWFRNGVKLYAADTVINTDGITFSSTVGGTILSRISADNVGRIGVYPSESFLVLPGYADGKSLRGLSVDLKGISEMRCADNASYNLHLIQQTAIYGAWVRYSSNNQTNNTWIGGADSSYNFKLNYSSDNGNNYVNELQLSNVGLLYARKGFDTEASTDATGSYRQGGITILRNNGATNGGITLLSGTGGIYIRPNGSTVTTNQTIFPTTGGLRVNDAPLATTNTPSIALPFSSYLSFGGFHALRGETNAVVLCAPVSDSGTVILRPNGNASNKYQFSINNIGASTLSHKGVEGLTLNRVESGGGYIRFNPGNQTTKGWIEGASALVNFSWQYYDGTTYLEKMYLTSAGNLLVTGGITMYSDIRKKTKLQDVELSLKQIADAPLIEHYYNSDSNKTTHVGSIAQYWAETIGNNWFCKLDSEGYYTMEIQNAALASAISIARELVKYESKTDKEIRSLKDEVRRLKKEIKILKSA